MAKLRIRVKGDLGSITLRGFLSMVEDASRMLKDYDAALSGEPRGSLEWVITDLQKGSLGVETESRSLLEGRNSGPEVAAQFISGWRAIEEGARTPPFLSERGMDRARSIVRLIGREGITGFEVSDLFDEAEVSVRAAANIERLVKVTNRSIGSVEGRIETVSIHGPGRFVIYHNRTRKAVTCRVDKERLREMIPTTDVMGRRVIVFGVLESNAKGEPLRIDPTRIRLLRSNEELPSRQSLSGSDPDLTGEMSTAEYLRRVRGG